MPDQINDLQETIAILQAQLHTTSKKLDEALASIDDLKTRQVDHDNHYHVMFEVSHAVKLLIDPENIQIVDANQAACQFYGYDKPTLIGMPLSDINILSQAQLYDEIRKAHIEERHFFNFHHRLASGEIRDVEVFSGPITMKGKTLLYSIINDVTERKNQEKQLQLLWHAINQSANSIVITDAQGNIEYVNPYFSQVTGYDFDAVIGQNPRFLKSGYFPIEQYTQLWQTITSGYEWSGEFQNKKKNGELYWEQATISPVLDEDGKILHFIGIKEDITERKRVEHDLRTSELRFRTLVNSLDDIVFTLDHQGRHTGVYGRWLEKYGVTPDIFIGKTSRDILGEESGKVHEIANMQALAGHSVSYEWVSGEQNIQTTLSPLQDDKGKITGVVGIGRDITSLKRIERHLREAQNFAHATVDALSAHIAILDEQGFILAVNRAWNQFAEQNGADPDTVGIGVNYIDMLKAVDQTSEDGPMAQAVLSGIQQIIQGEISDFSLEYPCHSPEENRWFMVRVTRFAEENPKRIVVAHENVTERVLAERIIAADKSRLEQLVFERTAQLQHLNTRINTILNNVSNPILLVDNRGKIDVTNPAFNQRFGYQADALFGQDLWSIFTDASRPLLIERWNNLSQDNAITPFQVQLLSKNGTAFDAEVSLNRVPENGGHVVCTLYDISHLKEVERVKDEFISMVSHELRNPIASILVSTDTMRKYYDRLSDEQKQSKLDHISTQVRRLTDLITSVLDMSRLEGRKNRRGHDLVDVGQVLRNTVDGLMDRIQAKQQTLQLDIVNSSLAIQGERSDITRIWQNLLTNAVKYTQEGGQIKVSLYGAGEQSEALPAHLSGFADSLPDDVQSGKYIVGFVQDNGHGIRPEDLPHLFTRFYRGWATNTDITGSGLGLALTRDILQLYGGDVAVSSQLGSGTTFCFWLPINDLEGHD